MRSVSLLSRRGIASKKDISGACSFFKLRPALTQRRSDCDGQHPGHWRQGRDQEGAAWLCAQPAVSQENGRLRHARCVEQCALRARSPHLSLLGQ